MDRRFWFEFERIDRPTPLNLGCGVTARDREDALGLMRTNIFPDRPMPRIVKVVEDVEPASLEQNHVAPNIGAMDLRGIWFPQGYT